MSQSLQELGFACVWCSVDDNTVSFVFWTEDEELADVLDEGFVFSEIELLDEKIIVAIMDSDNLA